MRRRLFISDIHMGDTRSRKTDSPYGSLDEKEAARLGRFLTSSEARACDELYVLGDFLDLWTTPIDVVPATPAEILASPNNQPIVLGLRAWREAGKGLHYVAGNHDMQVTAEDLAPLGFTFHAAPVVDGAFRFSHGHEHSLFNGPDPAGRPRPFGYYITRFVAKLSERNKLRMVLRNPDDVLALATGGKRLGEAVYDVVVKEADLDEHAPIVESDGSSLVVGDIRPMFANLYEEWSAAGRGSAATAVTCEWDPWYGMPIEPGTIAIAGHSHSRVFNFNTSSRQIYVNTGAWEDKVAHYAVSWTDASHAYAALYRWDGDHGVYVNKAGIAFT
jgi:UDP-2,3-diacylglucosamine pyrophosphatase LpxH